MPDRKVPCPAGAFCPRASVAMTTCNYQELLDRRPKTIIPAGPVTVLAQVYDQGTPIGGNICPPMSTSPSDVRHWLPGDPIACPRAAPIAPNNLSAVLFCRDVSHEPRK